MTEEPKNYVMKLSRLQSHQKSIAFLDNYLGVETDVVVINDYAEKLPTETLLLRQLGTINTRRLEIINSLMNEENTAHKN